MAHSKNLEAEAESLRSVIDVQKIKLQEMHDVEAAREGIMHSILAYVCMYACVCLCMYVCMSVCMHACFCLFVCA